MNAKDLKVGMKVTMSFGTYTLEVTGVPPVNHDGWCWFSGKVIEISGEVADHIELNKNYINNWNSDFAIKV